MAAKNETGTNHAGAQSSATGATLSGGLERIYDDCERAVSLAALDIDMPLAYTQALIDAYRARLRSNKI